jgi:hypothetical protein
MGRPAIADPAAVGRRRVSRRWQGGVRCAGVVWAGAGRTGGRRPLSAGPATGVGVGGAGCGRLVPAGPAMGRWVTAGSPTGGGWRRGRHRASRCRVAHGECVRLGRDGHRSARTGLARSRQALPGTALGRSAARRRAGAMPTSDQTIPGHYPPAHTRVKARRRIDGRTGGGALQLSRMDPGCAHAPPSRCETSTSAGSCKHAWGALVWTCRNAAGIRSPSRKPRRVPCRKWFYPLAVPRDWRSPARPDPAVRRFRQGFGPQDGVGRLNQLP